MRNQPDLSHQNEPASRLFPQDVEIVRMLAEGLRFKEIGARTKYAESSINTMIGRMYKRYEARSAAHLVHIFHQKGLLK